MDGRKESGKKKKIRKILGASIIAAVLVIACCFVYYKTEKYRAYNKAEQLLTKQEYQLAGQSFETLIGYKDAEEKAKEAYYSAANNFYKTEEYVQAIYFFEKASNYEDSNEKIDISWYNLAVKAQKHRNYKKAIKYFENAENYADAEIQKNKCIYAYADKLFEAAEHEEAKKYFDMLGDEIEEYGVPHFLNYYDAKEYIIECALNAKPTIAFKLGRTVIGVGGQTNNREILHLAQSTTGITTIRGKEVTIKPAYYIGVKIVAAWRNGQLDTLSEEEKVVFDKAYALVEQAKNETESDFERERWIHDWICENVTYSSLEEKGMGKIWQEEETVLLSATAYGALIENETLCQGYADAFYLLASLAGFEVRFQFGIANDEGHVWNSILLGEEWYYVDTTHDDISLGYDTKAKGYEYLNFSRFAEPTRIAYPNAISVNVAQEMNPEYRYYDKNGCIFNTVEEAVHYAVNQRIKQGTKCIQVKIIPQTEEVTYEKVLNAFYNTIYSGSGYIRITNLKDGAYLVFDFK